MKIRNYLTILLATVSIFLLLGLAGYLTYLGADDANPVKQAITNILPGLSLSGNEVESTDASPETEAFSDAVPASSVSAHSLIFVGDSRTVSMGKAIQDECIYIGKDGEGYRWFSSDGITELNSLLENDPTQTVIFNLGVNDPENADLYVELYNSISRQYTDTPFYYLSVNPLSDDSDFTITNKMIQEFNQTIKNAFPEHYLNCYDYLTEHGFDTVDGLHYTEETSRMIHDYVVEQVGSSV